MQNQSQTLVSPTKVSDLDIFNLIHVSPIRTYIAPLKDCEQLLSVLFSPFPLSV